MFTDDINQLSSRYELLCRASHFEPDASPVQNELASELRKLSHIIQQDLPELARKRSPHNFAELQQNLHSELQRFHEFCEFSHLANKVVVGLGGAFSAGKSSLINALLDSKRLATEVDPTTSLPTYLLKGKRESITALNLFKRRVELSQEEFLSLTHDEKERFGSQISGLLQSAFISLPDFPFANLALLDTPGYSKPDDEKASGRTDENIARAQLNSAQFIIWVVSAENGVISENDLRFLASLRQDIPRLVIISRADKRTPDDIKAIVELTRKTLDDKGLEVLDVIPYSSRKKKDYPLDDLLTHLNIFNGEVINPGFSVNFKRQFMAYQHFIEKEQHLALLRLEKLNRILAISDDSQVTQDSTELRQLASIEQTQLNKIHDDLVSLQKSFFHSLRKIGKHQKIELPEPEDIAALDLSQGVDVLNLLRQEREYRALKSSGATPPNWSNLKEQLINLNLDALNTGAHPLKVLGVEDTVKHCFALILAAFTLQGHGYDERRLELFHKLLNSMGLKQGSIYFLKQARHLDTDDFGISLDNVANAEALHLLIVDILALLFISDTDSSVDLVLQELFGLLDGDGVSGFFEECIGLTGSMYLAAVGNGEQKYQLARVFNSSKSLFADKAMARKWFQLAAEAGNAKAQFKIGEIYSRGQHGVEPDQKMAEYWYDKAAQQGHKKAIEIMSSSDDLWSNTSLTAARGSAVALMSGILGSSWFK